MGSGLLPFYFILSFAFFDKLFHQGKRHGSGSHQFNNGIDEYEGQWFMDQMHGRGCIMNGDGYSFDGNFVQGVPHGKGSMMTKVMIMMTTMNTKR